MPAKILIPNLDNLLERYIAGESENQLAQEAGVNRSTFRQRLLEAGITPRTQSESERFKWGRMTTAQRSNQVRAAHDATRGRKAPFSELCQRAKSREGSLTYNVAPEEIELAHFLRFAMMEYRWEIIDFFPWEIIHNFAVGPYNCDIGISPIAVEVWGGGWHPKPIDIERTKYILNAGYSILYVDLDQRRYPLGHIVTNYVVSLYETTRMNPSGKRQYWMVRGDGELIFKRFNDNNISLIPPFTSGHNPTNGQYVRVPR